MRAPLDSFGPWSCVSVLVCQQIAHIKFTELSQLSAAFHLSLCHLGWNFPPSLGKLIDFVALALGHTLNFMAKVLGNGLKW